MIVALLSLLFLGGGSGSEILAVLHDTKAEVKEVVVDDERKKAALATLKSMKARSKKLGKETKKLTKELDKVFKQDDPDVDDVDEIWGRHFEEVDRYNRDMIELRFELRAALTQEEWETIFPLEGGG